jgi:hypothetical protein
MFPKSRALLGIFLGVVIGFAAGWIVIGVQSARDAAEASAENCYLHGQNLDLQEEVDLLKGQLDRQQEK